MTPADGRAGLYTVTPDWHPLLGAVPGYEGLSLATGGSGHCFKLGPAIGALVAAQLTEKRLDFADASTFSLTRFDEGRELRSTYGGNRA
jgi:sarcosine oxidase subunit beta